MGKILVKNKNKSLEACPKCGKNVWLSTTQGPRCKNCGFLLEQDSMVKN